MDESLRVIDLRSDTVTKPTPAMREAMARAEVGDDVFGDDPTVKELESETACILGKEAALFTPSGTMANQLAIRSQTEPGDEILVEANAHIYYYEGGAPAALSGVMCRCLEGRRGVFTGAELEAALRPMDQHFPRTRLVCVENTHNRGGGKVWSIEEIREVAAAARKHNLQLHLDGARSVECFSGHRHRGAGVRSAFRHGKCLLFQRPWGSGRFCLGRTEELD